MERAVHDSTRQIYDTLKTEPFSCTGKIDLFGYARLAAAVHLSGGHSANKDFDHLFFLILLSLPLALMSLTARMRI